MHSLFLTTFTLLIPLISAGVGPFGTCPGDGTYLFSPQVCTRHDHAFQKYISQIHHLPHHPTRITTNSSTPTVIDNTMCCVGVTSTKDGTPSCVGGTATWVSFSVPTVSGTGAMTGTGVFTGLATGTNMSGGGGGAGGGMGGSPTMTGGGAVCIFS